MSNTLYMLTGPTAVGKTQLSMEWALENDAEIVSCDSLLFYRGMNIGTAKPSADEMARVPHHCIDLVEPSQQFNIASFVELAAKVVQDIHQRGKRVLITGGSGFYLKSFVAPVVDHIVIPPEIEEKVNALWQAEGLEGLVRELKSVAPDDYDFVDLNNSRRVMPALKRCLATGKGIRVLREQVEAGDFPLKGYHVQSVLLQRSLDSLRQRIAARTSQMLETGLISEVERLLEKGFERNASACHSIGYREVLAHLRGEIDRNQLEELINLNTMKLVKKQNKWFRHQITFDRVIDLDKNAPELHELYHSS